MCVHTSLWTMEALFQGPYILPSLTNKLWFRAFSKAYFSQFWVSYEILWLDMIPSQKTQKYHINIRLCMPWEISPIWIFPFLTQLSFSIWIFPRVPPPTCHLHSSHGKNTKYLHFHQRYSYFHQEWQEYKIFAFSSKIFIFPSRMARLQNICIFIFSSIMVRIQNICPLMVRSHLLLISKMLQRSCAKY